MKVIEINEQEFDEYVINQELANPWQTSFYGKACTALGYDVKYLGFEEGMSLKGATMLILKTVYLGQSISYSPRGVITEYEDSKNVENIFKALFDYCNSNKIMGFIMDPSIILTIRDKDGQLKINEQNIDKKLDNIMQGGDLLKANTYARDIVNHLISDVDFEFFGQNLGFEATLPRWYAVNNLPFDPRQLFKKIDKRIRNKLRKSIKMGVEIYKDDSKNVELIYDVLKTKFKRPIEYYKNLIQNNPHIEIYVAKINSEKYINNSKVLYEQELEKNDILNKVIQEKNALGKNTNHVLNSKMDSDNIIGSLKEHLVLSTQTLKDYPEGKIIGVALVSTIGKTVTIFEDGYLPEHGNLHPLNLLRWKILENYSNSNYRAIIMGEITGGFLRQRNPYYGVNEAKLAFRGNMLEYIGEFGIVINKTLFNLYLASTNKRHNFKI